MTRALGYAAGLAAVAAVSVLIGLVEQRAHLANISMLYLVAVLATASAFGSGPAVVTAFGAFLTFDWFFVDPAHTLSVADPNEWVTLLLFLATAVVTGQLAAGQRRRAEEAERREREAMVLSDVVRLMAGPDTAEALRAIAERLRRELGVSGVLIEAVHGDATVRVTAGEADAKRIPVAALPTRFLQEGAPPTAERSGEPGRWVRVIPPWHPPQRGPRGDDVRSVPIAAAGRRVGTLLLVRDANAPPFGTEVNRLLAAIAAQLGAAVDRSRLKREATEAEILRRSNEMKSALLNAVSHDLRTPLASILASAGSLRQRDVPWTEQERDEVAESIELEARRLDRIVGNLLDLSRVQAGALHPEKGWYDVGALVDEVVGRLRPLTARHRVIVDVEEDLPPVHLDYVEIDQVLTNLLENAARHTPAGTEVRVAARRSGDEVVIEVVDRGTGIAPSSLPHLFEPFFRSGTPKGTGLGLAVAKGLVEAHGGRIWAENAAQGGARFAFALPLAASPPVALSP